MGWKEEFGSYFHFTRRDRLAIIVISVLILLVWIAPRLFSHFGTTTPAKPDTSWIAAVRKLEVRAGEGKTSYSRENSRVNYPVDRPVVGRKHVVQYELFEFDPNLATALEWSKLGLRPRTITTILNFRSKGGRFRQAEDLRKVYGLFPDEFERLAPYIRIGHENSGNYTVKTEPFRKATTPKSISPVDINLADTSAFVALPGIGSKLAARIIMFREKLGGFYSVNQVAETFGLADSVFQKIKPYLQLNQINVQKININTATTDELKSHPYIRYQLAQAIIAFRNTHGKFQAVQDLRKIMAITDDIFKKLEPYLIFQ